MLASDFSRAIFRQWRGATVPDATWRPYVVSESVPYGWKWKILLASLYSTFGNNEAVFLYMVPPQLATLLQNTKVGPADGSFFAFPGALQNERPLKGIVLISEGGKDAAFPNELGTGNGGVSLFDSVNVLNTRRGGRATFDVPSGWALFGYQSSNGGAGTGNLVLSVMLISYDPCDCPDEEPAVSAAGPYGGSRYAHGTGFVFGSV